MAGKTFPAFPAHAQSAILRIWQEALGMGSETNNTWKWLSTSTQTLLCGCTWYRSLYSSTVTTTPPCSNATINIIGFPWCACHVMDRVCFCVNLHSSFIISHEATDLRNLPYYDNNITPVLTAPCHIKYIIQTYLIKQIYKQSAHTKCKVLIAI